MLPVIYDNSTPYRLTDRRQIAALIVQFCGESPEFWGDYAAHDWVALCQLYGPMVDLPRTWPMFCRDVEQMRHDLGVKGFLWEMDGIAHHALHDARDCKRRYQYLIQSASELLPNY